MVRPNTIDLKEEIRLKEELLPAEVSKITIQARDASRASVFIGEKFYFGFYREVLLKCNVREGELLTIEVFRKLLTEEERKKTDQYFARLLAARDHASSELRRKAFKKQFKSEIVNEVIDSYREKGFISDDKFAAKYINQKRARSKWGDIKIRAELLKKGVSNKDIDKAFLECEELDPGEIFVELIEKRKLRFKRETDILKRRKKIFDHLVRKGFQPGVILQYLDELMNLIDN